MNGCWYLGGMDGSVVLQYSKGKGITLNATSAALVLGLDEVRALWTYYYTNHLVPRLL